MQSRYLSVWVVLLAGASVLNSAPVRATEIIHCASHNHKYQYCRADTSNYATLERQISKTYCRLNDNWGYDRNGVWVDHGCEAEFKVGRDYYSSHHDYRNYDYDDDHDSNKTAVAAGAAVVGIALIAALASKNDSDNDEVASWAIGEFSGYDAKEKVDVNLRVFPGGSVSGSAGSHKFTGNLAGNQLEMGNYTFTIRHSGNGFEATDVKNSRHEVMFVRADSGYRSGY